MEPVGRARAAWTKEMGIELDARQIAKA
jgi:hypothetical protein